MDKTSAIVFFSAMAFLAFRLYQKYVKKEKGKTGNDTGVSNGSQFSSSSKDDDYEPYSKK
jgi:hypothetical protein